MRPSLSRFAVWPAQAIAMRHTKTQICLEAVSPDRLAHSLPNIRLIYMVDDSRYLGGHENQETGFTALDDR